MKTEKKAVLYMLFASLNFSLMGVFTKLAGTDFTSVEVAFYRFLVTLTLLILLVRGNVTVYRTDYLRDHFYRSLSGALAIFGFFYAITELFLGTAVSLNCTFPIWIIIIGVLILREKITKINLIGIIVSFLGILIVFQPEIERDQIFPTIIGLASGILSAVAYLSVRRLGRLGESPRKVVFYFSLLGSLISLIAMIIEFLFFGRGFNPIMTETGLYLLGVGIFSAIAQISLTKAFVMGNAFQMSAISYSTPVLSWIMGIILLDDQFDYYSLSGILLIVIAGIMVALYGQKPS